MVRLKAFVSHAGSCCLVVLAVAAVAALAAPAAAATPGPRVLLLTTPGASWGPAGSPELQERLRCQPAKSRTSPVAVAAALRFRLLAGSRPIARVWQQTSVFTAAPHVRPPTQITS